MKRCPACMAQLGVADRCMVCGLPISSMNEQNESALPIGTLLIGRFELGKALAQSRQALCYIAWDRELRQPVLVEEFFPKGACTRQNTEVKTYGQGASLFGTAVKKMYESPRPGNRSLPCIQAFMHGGTCFRVYAIEGGEKAREEAEKLLDHPIFFRDRMGRPLMSINALPIPALPRARNYRVLREEKKEEPLPKQKKVPKVWVILILILSVVGIGASLYFLLFK